MLRTAWAIISIVFLSQLFWGSIALSDPGSMKGPNGVIVEFKSQLDRKKADQQRIHEMLRVNVHFRAKSRPIDWVVPFSPADAKDTFHLKLLCSSYQRFKVVKHCYPNMPIRWGDSETPHAVGTSPSPQGTRTTTGEPPRLHCKLTKDYGRDRLMNGTLSPFWAQEYIGSDLAQQRIAEDSAAKNLKKPKVGLFDKGFVPSRMNLASDAKKPAEPQKVTLSNTVETVSNHHGLLVANLINGDPPVGIAPKFPLSAAVELSDHTVSWFQYRDDIESNRSPIADVYNISASIGYDSDRIFDVLSALEKKSILVVATGNDWPDPLPRNEQMVDSILVGSLYPHGYISHDSSEGALVDIAAPSDAMLQSTIGGGKFEHFGGTSGAAPLVTGTVALMKAYLPDMDTAEAREILKKTALPTSNKYQNPPKNGVGMLNTLKAVAVAQKLKKQKATKADRKALLTSAADTGVFDFKEEASKAFKDAMALLALSDTDANCAKRLDGFNLLRKAVLLDSSHDGARNKLIELFKGQGLTLNAEFYENLDKQKLLENLAKDAKSPNRGVRQSVARTASYLPEAFPTLVELLSDVAPVYQPVASYNYYEGFPAHMYSPSLIPAGHAVAHSIGSQYAGKPRELRKLVDQLAKHSDPNVRGLASAVAVLFDVSAIDHINRGLKDSDPSVQAGALEALQLIKDNRRKFEYFQHYIGSSDAKVTLAAAELGATVDNEPDTPATAFQPAVKGTPYRDLVRKKLLESSDPVLKAKGISMLDANLAPVLLAYARTETDPKTLLAIAKQASALNRPDVLRELQNSSNEDIRATAIRLQSYHVVNNDISFATSGLNDPSKKVKREAADVLIAHGIARRRQGDRFEALGEQTINNLSWAVLTTVTDEWKETQKLRDFWKRDWCIEWFNLYLQHPSVPEETKVPLRSLVQAAQQAPQDQTPGIQ